MRPFALLAGLALLLPAPVAAQDLVLVDASVVDVTDGSIRSGVSVIIRDGMIDAVEEGRVDTPDGVRSVDLDGRYLAPGLIDAHVHVESVDQVRRALGTGVTTMRSMGSSHYADVGLRELHRNGHLEGPRRPRPSSWTTRRWGPGSAGRSGATRRCGP